MQALDQVGKDYRIDTDQVTLAGFSGGAMVTLDMTLRQTIPVARCIALCPSVVPYLEQAYVGKNKLQKDSITIIYGEFEDQRNIHPVVGRLREQGVPCKNQIFPGIAHDYPRDIVDRTKEIIIKTGDR